MNDYFPFTFEQEIEIAVRLVVATVFGAIVGWDREHVGKPAGIRTLALVSLGAALFTIISAWAFGPGADPSRVASYVVAGIGFLGGGVIFRTDVSIAGVTTAASIWATAAIGMASGAGMFVIAGVATVIVFLLLRIKPFTDDL